MSHSTLVKLGVLLSHSLRQSSRSVATHRFRMGSLFVAFWLLISAHFYSALFGSAGREFMRALSYLDLLLILLGGSSYFGTAITEDKEQGTLGLLKIAGFSNIGLLFGKSTTRIVNALAIFVIQLPFACLAMVLGGSTAQQILAAYLILVAYMILLANVGLLCSVLCRRSSTASACTVVIGALLIWSGKLAQLSLSAGIYRSIPVLRRALEWIADWQSWFSAESCLSRVVTSHDTPLVTDQFWSSLLFAACLFSLSWLIFSRSSENIEATVDAQLASAPFRSRRWKLGVSRPWSNAIAWKEFHFVAGGWARLLGKTFIFAVLYCLSRWYEATFFTKYSIRLVEVLHGCLVVILLIESLSFANGFLGQEHAQGTLPNLWLTPHSLIRISCSKLLGVLPSMVPTCLALLVTSQYLKTSDAILLDWASVRFFLWSVLIVLLHLTTFYSLKVRRGALAWAVVTLILALLVLIPTLEAVRISLRGQAGLNFVLSDTNGPEAWMPLVYVCVLACLGLQLAIVRQARLSVGESSS